MSDYLNRLAERVTSSESKIKPVISPGVHFLGRMDNQAVVQESDVEVFARPDASDTNQLRLPVQPTQDALVSPDRIANEVDASTAKREPAVHEPHDGKSFESDPPTLLAPPFSIREFQELENQTPHEVALPSATTDHTITTSLQTPQTEFELNFENDQPKSSEAASESESRNHRSRIVPQNAAEPKESQPDVEITVKRLEETKRESPTGKPKPAPKDLTERPEFDLDEELQTPKSALKQLVPLSSLQPANIPPANHSSVAPAAPLESPKPETNIHVSIGRVEVRANMATGNSTTNRRPSIDREPSQLDRYLRSSTGR